MCHGLGAASFVSCDRCGGSGKRINDVQLTNADDAPTSTSCRAHCRHMGTAVPDDADPRRRYGGAQTGDKSGPHFQPNSTGAGRHGGGSKDDCIRNKEDAPDGPELDADANAGGLKLTRTTDCAKCKGSGKVPAPRHGQGGGYCPRCAGARLVEEATELVLPIPAGVEKGQTEVYRDKGHVDLAGEKNTIYLGSMAQNVGMRQGLLVARRHTLGVAGRVPTYV